MIPTILLCIASVVTSSNADQLALLTTFREEFIAITPGKGKHPQSFQMGGKVADSPDSKRGVRRVSFDYNFAIAKYEVPQNLWKAVMGSNPSEWQGERNSVEKLSYDEAVLFCTKVTKLLRSAKLIDEKQEIRLPNEAEWEYTARAGTATAYSFGDDVSLLDKHAWSTQNASGNDPAVGDLKPNPWGLYDVHGYLWEWCEAFDDTSPANEKKLICEKSEQKQAEAKRVLRGGSWKDSAAKLTSSYRVLVSKDLRDSAVGLRCVLANVRK